MQENILISEVKFIYWVDVDSINYLVNREKFHKNICKYLKNLSVQHQGIYVQGEVTLLIAAHHRVAFETAEISMLAKSKVIFGPLKGPNFFHHPAGQCYAGAHDSRLILGFHGEVLTPIIAALRFVLIIRGGRGARR